VKAAPPGTATFKLIVASLGAYIVGPLPLNMAVDEIEGEIPVAVTTIPIVPSSSSTAGSAICIV